MMVIDNILKDTKNLVLSYEANELQVT